jgi:UDP-N-acetylglucosamine--N-acetylmuramyl-(pentapeptide) pyrophosphoryl-undecaprenol N-acetylglucosamine transferase
MVHAWHAADLLLSRAGAGTIAEQVEFEVPGILIPYPHATDNHQDSNADFLVSTIGGGWKYREKELDSRVLATILKPLLEGESHLLQEKRTSLQHYKNKACRPQFSSMIQKHL